MASVALAEQAARLDEIAKRNGGHLLWYREVDGLAAVGTDSDEHDRDFIKDANLSGYKTGGVIVDSQVFVFLDLGGVR